MTAHLFFLVWWLLVNGTINYLSMDFLLYMTKAEEKRYMLLWLALSLGMTAIAVCFQTPNLFFADVLFLAAFAKAVLRIHWRDMAAPAAVLFTLYTFMEGGAAVILSFLSANVELGSYGSNIQFLVSALMVFCFFSVLLFIRKRYFYAFGRPASAYLYILLLPCIVIVTAIRFGLRLDSMEFAEYLSSFGGGASAVLLLAIGAAAVMFIIMIEVFGKIIYLTEKEKTAVLMSEQLRQQRIYVEEARKRNERYAAVQHDIDNHLLVLSGLLKEKKYVQAGQYADKLCRSEVPAAASASTGKVVLDVLLGEKIGYARDNRIDVVCNVHIPKAFAVEDMDLCVVFSNIMDNAICACKKVEDGNRFIALSARVKSSFLVINARNSTILHPAVKMGTGLHNIKNIAGKYQGTIEIDCAGNEFCIKVLLCSGGKLF